MDSPSTCSGASVSEENIFFNFVVINKTCVALGDRKFSSRSFLSPQTYRWLCVWESGEHTLSFKKLSEVKKLRTILALYICIYIIYTKSDHTTSTFTTFSYCTLAAVSGKKHRKSVVISSIYNIYIYFFMYKGGRRSGFVLALNVHHSRDGIYFEVDSGSLFEARAQGMGYRRSAVRCAIVCWVTEN